MSRVLFLILVGLGGAAILVALGVWQVQRLAWKEAVIADIEARIVAPPVDLPAEPSPETDAYLPVAVTGQFTGETRRVLVSQKTIGAGYRLITAFETAEGAVLIDRGFAATEAEDTAPPEGVVEITGNLQWPQETDSFTPEPDRAENIWFARDVSLLSVNLDTRPVLIVARQMSPASPGVTPLPVDTAAIPNDHLEYAMTWFSLAAIWLAMSFLFFLRRRRGQPAES